MSITKLIKKLYENEAFRGTLIVSAGIFLGNIFSYLVQVYLGRTLSVVEYGIFNALLSTSVIIGILATTFSTSLVKMVSDLKVAGKFDTLTHLFFSISFWSTIVGFVLGFLFYVFDSQISKFLNIADVAIVSAFGIFLTLNFTKIVPLTFLQGLLRFKAFAFSNVFINAIRLAFIVLALYLGYRVGGIFVFMGFSSLIAYVVVSLFLKKNFRQYSKVTLHEYYRKLINFSGPVLLIQIGMIFLNNTDILLVKHYFNEHDAGLYAGLVTVSKVFLFLANTIAVVMYPQISNFFAEGKDYMSKLKPYLNLQLFVILSGIVVFYAFPEQIIRVMFGTDYLPIAGYLPKFVVFLGIYVLLNFLSLFLLAVEKAHVYKLFLGAVVIQALLIVFFHSTINTVVNINLLTAASLLIGVLIYYKNAGITYSSGLQAGKDN